MSQTWWRWCWISLLNLWGLGVALAQSERQFDEAALRERQAERPYQYGQEPLPDPASAEGPLSDQALTRWRWVMYAVVGLGLISLAVLILRRTLVRESRTLTPAVPEGHEDPEDIRQIDLEAALPQAIARRDYRLAVRLLFLDSLRHLTERGHIDWQPHKTNHAYWQELSAAWRGEFGELLRTYEYVWYGQFELSEAQYERLARRFRAFRSRATQR